MNSDQALLLVDGWAKAKGRSAALRTIVVESTGDFHVEIGAASFRFSQKAAVLLVSGYVASGQRDLLIDKIGQQTWHYLTSIAALQPATLGDGQLELYTGTADPTTKKPAVYLTKTFASAPRSVEQFVAEINWLARWATYWRDERWDEVFAGQPRAQLEAEARSAQSWAVEKHPRPW